MTTDKDRFIDLDRTDVAPPKPAPSSTNAWIESMVKTIQLIHRTLIVFCIIVMGMYSQPPPSIQSYDKVEKKLVLLLEREDRAWPITDSWPHVAHHSNPRYTLFGRRQYYKFSDSLMEQGAYYAMPNGVVQLCYRGSNGEVRVAEEVATEYRAQLLRFPLETRLSEYGEATLHGLWEDQPRAWIAHCQEFLAPITGEYAFMDEGCEIDVHCSAVGATVKVTPTVACLRPGHLYPPKPDCERVFNDLKIEYAKDWVYSWTEMKSQPLVPPMGPNGPKFDFHGLISDIRDSVHYKEISGMTPESALSHVRQMRAQLIAGWSIANKTAMSIPTPSRLMISFILAALCLYVTTCAMVIVIRIRRNRATFQPDISAVTWIGLAGNGFPTAMTAVVTGLLPWLALESSIRHESTANELAGALSSTAWTYDEGLLPVLEGMGPNSSAIMVSFLAVAAALSIILLRLALRQPRSSSS